MSFAWIDGGAVFTTAVLVGMVLNDKPRRMALWAGSVLLGASVLFIAAVSLVTHP